MGVMYSQCQQSLCKCFLMNFPASNHAHNQSILHAAPGPPRVAHALFGDFFLEGPFFPLSPSRSQTGRWEEPKAGAGKEQNLTLLLTDWISGASYFDPLSLSFPSEKQDDKSTQLIRSTGEGNGTPLQYSCLENPMGRGAW